MNRPTRQPRLVFADADGQIYDHPDLLMAGVDGGAPALLDEDDLLALPRGSDLFTLPGRLPVGIHPDTGEPVVFDGDGAPVQAVAAFLAPAHTLSHGPAYVTDATVDAPTLPTYAYAAVGFRDDAFWSAGVRVDPDTRQDPWRFDIDRLERQVQDRLQTMGDNRVVRQLERCALEYGCRAAQNFFIGRHEAPLPTSISCNAQCVGCISLQPDGEFRASHERLDRAPTADEVASTALSHLERVPDGVVSFGQGCEGEPLLMDELLVATVQLVRAASSGGTVHLNSNASRPDVVAAMAAAGLDSMRVSLNSTRPAVYDSYYHPRGYGFDDVERSIVEMKRRERFVSLNYLVFPGVNDTEDEWRALEPFLERTGVDMIQWRNLNIDPDLYARSLPPGTMQPGFGMRCLFDRVRERFPAVRYGYFNPRVRAQDGAGRETSETS